MSSDTCLDLAADAVDASVLGIINQNADAPFDYQQSCALKEVLQASFTYSVKRSVMSWEGN